MHRILFVDDDPAAVRTFQRLFPAPEYDVETACDGAAALCKLELCEVDLLVADFEMPVMNGGELLARARDRWPDVVRMLVSGRSDFRTAVDVVNRGEVFRMLAKPWDDDELRFSVKLALASREMNREREMLKHQVAAKSVAVQHAHGELQRLNQDLESIIHSRTGNLLDALSAALDMRDNETQLHSRRVSAYAARLADELGLPEEERRIVEQGALLHDVGKIGVPDAVLLKAGPLDAGEWEVMKRHPGIGFELLSSIDFLDGARRIILEHQERWDGTGYPAGLRGDAICIGARIFAVVDTYDAVTSDRPYRKARGHEAAQAEIEAAAGGQLDPVVVAAFLRLPASTWDAIRDRIAEEAAAQPADPMLGAAA